MHSTPRNLAPCKQSQPSASCGREGQGTECPVLVPNTSSTSSGDLQPSKNPDCPFSPHPTRCRLTRRLLCNVPESTTALMLLQSPSSRGKTSLRRHDSRRPHGRKPKGPSFFSPVIASPCQGDAATNDCMEPSCKHVYGQRCLSDQRRNCPDEKVAQKVQRAHCPWCLVGTSTLVIRQIRAMHIYSLLDSKSQDTASWQCHSTICKAMLLSWSRT